MALNYSWAQYIERIKKHISSGFPGDDWNITDNEVLLYINEAMAYGAVGQIWNGAKVLGEMQVPEGYIVKFELDSLTQDTVSGKWVTYLPQPPLSIPLGYSINRIYPATTGFGQGKDVILLKSKRIGRRRDMPLQFGVYGEIQNRTLILWASDGSSLSGQRFYAEMPSTRAVSVTDAMPLPDDASKMLFDIVVSRIKDRMQIPQDIVQDDLPSGNKSS